METWRAGKAVVFGPGEDNDTEKVEEIAETAEASNNVEMRRGGLRGEIVAVRPADRSPCDGCGGCGTGSDGDGWLYLAEIAAIGLLIGIGAGAIIDELTG